MKFRESAPPESAVCFSACLVLGELFCSRPRGIQHYQLRSQRPDRAGAASARSRGKITLRNDSQTPQKIAVLQISSSLDWRSIKAGDKAVQFVTQPYTSDIDHTGGLSEAIVTLPQAIAPKATIELEIGLRRRHPARCDAAHAHRHAGGSGATARTGTRSMRSSRRCAARDTWRGIRLRPKSRIFRKATVCSRFWADGRIAGS